MPINESMCGESFNERFERLLNERGLQKKDIAGVCGISRNGISTWKATGTVPRADIAVKIAGALGVTTEYLITGEIPGIAQTAPGEDLARRIISMPENKRAVVRALLDALEKL